MMNRYIFFKQTLLCVTLFSSMACSSLGNKTSNFSKDMDTAFNWQPQLSSPRNYPMEVMFAKVRLGNTDNWIGAMGRFTGAGLGKSDGSADIDNDSEDGKLEIPSGIDVVWLSYLEKKFYRLKAKLSPDLQCRMLKLFREGYYDYPLERYWTYNSFVINLLPNGHVWLYLTGIGRSTLVCDSLIGEEVSMSLKEFDEDGYNFHKTLDAFCRGRLRDYPKAEANFKQYGIPDSLWEKYSQRYRYQIDYDFEDPKAILGNDYVYHFITGEFFHKDKEERFDSFPCIQNIEMLWNVGTTKYAGYFFFDEDEIIKTFARAFNPHNKVGKLIIYVSKYNNRFNIHLLVNGEKYPLLKTKIHVFYYTPQNKNKKDHLYYWNYDGEVIKDYIGG